MQVINVRTAGPRVSPEKTILLYSDGNYDDDDGVDGPALSLLGHPLPQNHCGTARLSHAVIYDPDAASDGIHGNLPGTPQGGQDSRAAL